VEYSIGWAIGEAERAAITGIPTSGWSPATGSIADALRIDADTGEATELTASVDSSSARAHQHAAGARRRPPKETNHKGGR
jgi:hypothetical protein